jgi:predicted transcriptional regulator of viral defense system
MTDTLRENVSPTQRERVLALLARRGMARLSELGAEGVTAATVSRLEREGAVVRLSRGLYQLPGAPLDTHHALAEAAKKTPKGVIALTSALAFHGLTDEMPRRIWMAIGHKDWAPKASYPPLRIVRFADRYLRDGVETHLIEGVPVPIFGVAKTVADLFRHRRSVGANVALQGLDQALRHRKATPAEIADHARRGGAWTALRPYLEAFTAGG